MGKISTYNHPATVFDSIVDGFLTSGFVDDFIGRSAMAIATPKTQTIENKDAYIISLAAPGVSKEDFNVTLAGRIITLEYKKGEKGSEFFNFSSFKKTWTAPKGVESKGISAEYVDGILNIIVKKPDIVDEESEVITIN